MPIGPPSSCAVEESRRQSVRVGHAGATNAEVLGGVDPGDQVVVFPSDRLSPGARVKVRQSASSTS